MSCAPILPPYVNVDQLGYSEIRTLVVKTLRQLRTLRSLEEKGINGMSLPQTTVILEAPCNAARRPDDWNNLSYRLLPSLNLLVILSSTLLEIFDVETGVCKLHITEEYEILVAVRFEGFAYEECSSTSFRLFVAGLDSVWNVA